MTFTPDQERYARSLARLMVDEDRSDPLTASDGLERAAKTSIRLEMQAMVHGITKNIRFDLGVLTEYIEEELKRQCSEVSVEDVVKRAVEKETALVVRDVERRVGERVKELMTNAIDRRMGGMAEAIATRIQKVNLDALYPRAASKGTTTDAELERLESEVGSQPHSVVLSLIHEIRLLRSK